MRTALERPRAGPCAGELALAKRVSATAARLSRNYTRVWSTTNLSCGLVRERWRDPGGGDHEAVAIGAAQ